VSLDAEVNNQSGRVRDNVEFVSFKDVYLMAFMELNEMNDESGQDYILNKYKDVLEIKDSVIRPVISLSAYAEICNRERIYQTGDFINKVITDDYLITTHKSNYSKLLLINSIDIPDENSFRVVRLTSSIEADGRTKTSCGQEILVDYFHNRSRCKNDRRVWISAKTYFLYFQNNMYLPYSEIKVFGEKRNGFCVWDGYQTELNYRNVSFSVNAFALENPNWGWITPENALRVPFTVTVPDYYGTSDVVAVTAFKGPTGAWLFISNGTVNANPLYEFTMIKIEASSRGTNNNWAVINCE
jgi:hypothetical protein